jgi:hypothetical protein
MKPAPIPSPLIQLLEGQRIRPRIYARSYAGASVASEVVADCTESGTVVIDGATCEVTIATSPSRSGGLCVDASFRIREGEVAAASLGFAFDCEQWSEDEWVFMPSCVYAGNRFPATPADFKKRSDPRPDPHNWVTVSRAPRLTHGPGASAIQVLAGDCATPCIGVFSPDTKRGFLVLTEQGTALGDAGLTVSESDDRRQARVSVLSPGVRIGGKYNFAGPLADRGARLYPGMDIRMRLVIHAFPATSPEDIYAVFARCRKDLAVERERCDLPFAEAFRLIDDKHQRSSWVEQYGYWSVGMRESPSQDWQTGWVGGPNTMWPLLIHGSAESVHRALRAWDFVVTSATPSGFVKGCFSKGTWQPDHGHCYLRYSADTLYFLMKTLIRIRAGEFQCEAKPTWLAFARGLCDAFVRVWDSAGHLPHYVDAETGAAVIGGSCAAALAPAGLILAARYFNEPRYSEVAQAAARRYRDHFLAKGITNGGPGDIAQNVDSESAAALLESFVVLYEELGDVEWSAAATRAAAYAATWVTSYDFRFPATSTFGQLDMLTSGTVWANVQNKHAAPGICTLSGSSLLKLYRATGDTLWLDLIRDIARCLPQYVSRADRPIADARTGKRWKVMPPGWVNERVNLSDWEVRGEPWEEIGVGEIFGGSCWSEPAILNTIAEVPGIYLDTATGRCTVFDHVLVQVSRIEPDRITLRITNPTSFPAAPILLAEGADERRDRRLGVDPLAGCQAISIPALATVDHVVSRATPVRPLPI